MAAASSSSSSSASASSSRPPRLSPDLSMPGDFQPSTSQYLDERGDWLGGGGGITSSGRPASRSTSGLRNNGASRDPSSSSSSSSLQSPRPPLPIRSQSSSTVEETSSSNNGMSQHPSSPALSESRIEDDSLRRMSIAPLADDWSTGMGRGPGPKAAGGGPASGGAAGAVRRRADLDRVKSRAVDTRDWNWETERARLEATEGVSPSAAVSSDARRSFISPIPPRLSSRPTGAAPPPRPKIDTSEVGAVDRDPGHGHHHRPSASQVAAKKGTASGSRRDQMCDACGKPMTGQFVRALGVVFHLDCFRCRDCNKVVASKFFPATEEMRETSSPRSSNTGEEDSGAKPSPIGASPSKLFPLCETDYFRRLDLLCAKCGGALRGSYITALGKKFHVEHFTCSVCPTIFGPQDSYYEHEGRVFCHFHYSTRFAIRCTGCRTAILKQFVEINRNNQDEHWHPECYMIHKFWNIKLSPTAPTPRENGSIASEPTTVPSAPAAVELGVAPTNDAAALDAPSPDALETEATETPSSLKEKQRIMEEQVYRIWTVLSAFEESSAACISEMLRHVSSGRYLGGVRMAERFIFHVEILFSAIDDIERDFRREEAKGISHIREARMLCKKIVNFFSLLSHTQETGARRMGITQELLSLVTGLAHYLKILIRIALTGALKLERDYGNHEAIDWFLDQLAYLAERASVNSSGDEKSGSLSDQLAPSEVSMQREDGKWYGYNSLPRSTTSSASEGNEGATDLCVACGETVEEECVRMGISMRWHASCLRCKHCRRKAQKSAVARKQDADNSGDGRSLTSTEEGQVWPASGFALEVGQRPSTADGSGRKLYITWCSDHAPPHCRKGFETGTRLEQYAFLLRVALNRLYALLKKRGVVPASPPSTVVSPTEMSTSDSASTIQAAPAQSQDASYSDSADIKRMKSVNLAHKLSTKAKVPRISTVVGSPSGRQTQAASMQQRPSPTTSSESQQHSAAPSPRQPGDSERDAALQLQQQRSRSPARRLRRSPSPESGPQKGGQRGLHSREASPTRATGAVGTVVPIRPAFARHNTDVQIRQDTPMRQPSGDEQKDSLRHTDEGLTLGDIPQLLEAEQAREQRRSLHHEGGRSLSELSALELFIVKHLAVMMLQQSALKDLVPLDDLIEFIEMRKNTFWGKLFKSGKDKKKSGEKKGIFGIPLEVLVEKNGADSTLGASKTNLRVPSFIDDIVSAMKQMDVSVEGIFRKNGNIRRLKELSDALDRDSSSVNLQDDNPVQLAALLKRFLRELPDPLLTFKLHRLFVMSQKLEPESERLRILHLVTILLPKAHRDTLEVLFVFLKWVASFSHVDEETGSKMDLQNLALVLGPNILYAKSQDPAKDELFLANRAILSLLENQDELWMVPPDLEAVLQDRELLSASAELTSRDILKRCEKYAKRARYPGASGSSGRSGGYASSGGMPSDPHIVPAGRQQRPEYHDPATMRQIESPQYTNGLGAQSMSKSASSLRSPVDGSGERPPWASNGGGSGSTPYGSPDRSYHQQPYHHPLGGSSGGGGSWSSSGGGGYGGSSASLASAGGGGQGSAGRNSPGLYHHRSSHQSERDDLSGQAGYHHHQQQQGGAGSWQQQTTHY